MQVKQPLHFTQAQNIVLPEGAPHKVLELRGEGVSVMRVRDQRGRVGVTVDRAVCERVWRVHGLFRVTHGLLFDLHRGGRFTRVSGRLQSTSVQIPLHDGVVFSSVLLCWFQTLVSADVNGLCRKHRATWTRRNNTVYTFGLVWQECIQLIKSNSKDINNATQDFYFKQILFFWYFCSSKNPEKSNVSRFPQKYEAAQLFSTLIIRNVSWAVYYYDFWRSCDTEDCSNDAENTAFITAINYSLTYSMFT